MPAKSDTTLILATRRSPLARRQAELAREALVNMPGAWWKTIELLEMTTTGDEKRDWSLANQGGKGLFTKELEDALLDGRAHLAVHSAKDLPTTLPDGLTLAGFLPRADARDMLIRRTEIAIPRRIATGSPRRRAQAQGWWPALEWSELRGNLDTRLKKIAKGDTDATFLAVAGLNRLGIAQWDGLVFEPISVERMIPAAGQGAIALECRQEDASKYIAALCPKTIRAVRIERAVLAMLGGGCQSASAVHYHEGTLYVFHEPKGRALFPVTATNDSTALTAAEASIRAWLGNP